jgi:hypothetical protein
MSDQYRDGCPGKKWQLGWFIVQAVYLAAWLTDPFNRKGTK